MQEIEMQLHYNYHQALIEWCHNTLGHRTRMWGEIPNRTTKWSYFRSVDYLTVRFYYYKDATLFKLTWL